MSITMRSMETVSTIADDTNETTPGFYYDAPKPERTIVTAAPEFPQTDRHSRSLFSEELALIAYGELMTNNGFSLDAFGRGPSAGFMVSLPNQETIIPLASIENWNGLLAMLICQAPLHLARSSSGGESFGGVYWGGWIDGDLLYLDLSVNVNSRERAEYLGRKWNQKAVWNVADRCSIRLDG